MVPGEIGLVFNKDENFCIFYEHHIFLFLIMIFLYSVLEKGTEKILSFGKLGGCQSPD